LNARIMAQRSEADRGFIVAHEVWHCALRHFLRQLGRDSSLWKQACGYEVNHLLSKGFSHRPSDGLWNRRFQGLSAEETYARLTCGTEQPGRVQ